MSAIPNIGGMLGDAQQIFQDRLQPERRCCATGGTRSGHPEKLTQVLDTVRGFSDYLGNEVVITAGGG